MGMFDVQCIFTYTSAAAPYTQAFTDAAVSGTTNVSYYAYDSAGGVVADGTTPARSIGAGTPMWLITQVTVNAGGGTAASIRIKLVGSTATAFSTSNVIADSGAIGYASVAITAAGTNYSPGTTVLDEPGVYPLIVMAVPPSVPYRYWRVEYTLNNNDNDFTVSTFLSASAPSPLFHTGIFP
jgi:hypothetical protein